MEKEDKRNALPGGNFLSLGKDRIEIVEEIGRGGSCIAYKGKKKIPIEDNIVYKTVVVKEFYPLDIDITRNKLNWSLNPSSSEVKILFDKKMKLFGEAQANHIRFCEKYPEHALPPIFGYENANNTKYAVSDPGKGELLSQIINLEDLNLQMITSIMESICSGIGKIHEEQKLYLDCKPDNFFYCHMEKDEKIRIYLFDFDTIVLRKDVREGRNLVYTKSEGWAPSEQEIKYNADTRKLQYKYAEKMGYHTDIYSIEAIFFWLLTQKKPTEKDIKEFLKHEYNNDEDRELYKNENIFNATKQIVEDLLLDVNARIKKYDDSTAIVKVGEQFRKLYQDINPAQSLKHRKMNNVPFKNSRFVGRRDKLAEIENNFHKGNNIVVLYGQGGMGKTSVALQYVYEHQEDYSFVHWIDAHTRESIIESCKKIYKKSGKFSYSGGTFFEQYNMFISDQEKACIVFDNMDLSDKEMLPILNQCIADCYDTINVIVTWRTEQKSSINGFEYIYVYTLSNEEAVQLLSKDVEDDNTEHAEKLAERLHGHPLALEMARAYIVATPCCSWETYLNDLNIGTNMLNQKGLIAYKDSVHEVIETTFLKIEKQNKKIAECVKEFLLLCSYYSPNHINISMMAWFANLEKDNQYEFRGKLYPSNLLIKCFKGEKTRASFIRLLLKYALIHRGTADNISIHELTQEITRDYIWPSPHNYHIYSLLADTIIHKLILADKLKLPVLKVEMSEVYLNSANVLNTELEVYERGNFCHRWPSMSNGGYHGLKINAYRELVTSSFYTIDNFRMGNHSEESEALINEEINKIIDYTSEVNELLDDESFEYILVQVNNEDPTESDYRNFKDNEVFHWQRFLSYMGYMADLLLGFLSLGIYKPAFLFVNKIVTVLHNFVEWLESPGGTIVEWYPGDSLQSRLNRATGNLQKPNFIEYYIKICLDCIFFLLQIACDEEIENDCIYDELLDKLNDVVDFFADNRAISNQDMIICKLIISAYKTKYNYGEKIDVVFDNPIRVFPLEQLSELVDDTWEKDSRGYYIRVPPES